MIKCDTCGKKYDEIQNNFECPKCGQKRFDNSQFGGTN